jgi:phage-related baseplate assembly protein
MTQEPVFVETDPAIILSEILADFTALTGLAVNPGQPEYALLSTMAYHKVLTNQRINAAGKSVLIAFSEAPVLDYIAQMFGIVRLTDNAAGCTLTFTLVDGHLNVTIPLGTRVASTDGLVIFATNDDVTVDTGTNTVNINATCQIAGLSGNGYDIGNISVLMDVYAYITSVGNLDVTSGGSSGETDVQLRERMTLATSQYSVTGSRNAYIYWTKSASSLISDVEVVTYSENNLIPYGEVWIYPLVSTGNFLPSDDLISEILLVLSSEKIRPMTDTVLVKSPTIVEYSLNIGIVKNPNYDGSVLTTAINSLLVEFGVLNYSKLGIDIVASYVESLCRIDGVYDVTVEIISAKGLTGRNLTIEPWELSKQTGVTITVTGSNNG